LQLLAGAELIHRSTLGSQVFYRANEKHPLYPELRSLLQKTFGVFSLLSQALEPLARQIKVAFVFGSIARGEEKASSDIDLMIVGSVSLDQVLDRIVPVEKQLGRSVQPLTYSVKQLRDRRQTENHFLRSLEKTPKVFLIGDNDDFREASRIRVV
jgi:predicted nucleotidyltransferase